MSRISPFVGLLFDRSRVGSLDRVTTPPYDVISEEERRRYLDASPYNVVRLELGQEHGGGGANDKYRRAASELRSWRREGALVPTVAPAYYPYEMEFSLYARRRHLRGLICAVELEDHGGSVVPHERTMPAPIEDRLRLTRALRVNLSCIHAVFRGPSEALTGYLETASERTPDAETADEAGVHHRLWICHDTDGVDGWLAEESLMIADGHHRYAMALRYRDEMRARLGPGPWDRVMMLVTDAATQEPPVLPFHRILTGGTLPPRGDRVRDLEEALQTLDDDGLVYGRAALENGVLVHRVDSLKGEPPTVLALHDQLLRESDAELRFTPDPVEAESAVRRGEAVAAFFLPPTSVVRIRAVVDRGERLPRKSTFFWPKPRTGMVVRPLGRD